jgi:hypothetical protein
MAIGWLAVLQMVPWSDVISNAPKVADGAKKLWSSVGRKPPQAAAAADDVALSPEGRAIAMLEARVAAVEAAASELHQQMLSSAELVKALAEQNAQLILRIEVNRVRLLVLAGVTAVATVIAVLGLALPLLR